MYVYNLARRPISFDRWLKFRGLAVNRGRTAAWGIRCDSLRMPACHTVLLIHQNTCLLSNGFFFLVHKIIACIEDENHVKLAKKTFQSEFFFSHLCCCIPSSNTHTEGKKKDTAPRNEPAPLSPDSQIWAY